MPARSAAMPVWKQVSRCHGWQFRKAAGARLKLRRLSIATPGPDPESRVFNLTGAEVTKGKDAGLRLSPEWQRGARLTDCGRGGGGTADVTEEETADVPHPVTPQSHPRHPRNPIPVTSATPSPSPPQCFKRGCGRDDDEPRAWREKFVGMVGEI